MSKTPSTFVVVALAVALAPWSRALADRSIDERHAAAPKGLVEIVVVAGAVDVMAWDRPEVEVTGTVDDSVERVDVASAGDRTSVHVVMRAGMSWHGGEARLNVHVPAQSSVTARTIAKLTVLRPMLWTKLRSILTLSNGNRCR